MEGREKGRDIIEERGFTRKGINGEGKGGKREGYFTGKGKREKSTRFNKERELMEE